MIQTKLNIFRLIKELEIKTGTDLHWINIAKESQITRQTWDRLRQNKAERIELRTIDKLLSFFRSYGMPIAVSDLFTVTIDDDDDKSSDNVIG